MPNAECTRLDAEARARPNRALTIEHSAFGIVH
jgi:hypothetical protein